MYILSQLKKKFLDLKKKKKNPNLCQPGCHSVGQVKHGPNHPKLLRYRCELYRTRLWVVVCTSTTACPAGNTEVTSAMARERFHLLFK